MTVAEFLTFEDGTDTRYQLIDGELMAMAPPMRGNGALAARLMRHIGNALGSGCEVIAQAGIVPEEDSDSFFVADLAVTCTASLASDPIVPAPRLIVEVLSPSTTATDLNRKLPAYRAMPSVQDVLIVATSEARVEHWQREADGWKVRDLRPGDMLEIAPLGVTIDVGALYDGVLDTPEAGET
jgi:Uma2 family endonuclease